MVRRRSIYMGSPGPRSLERTANPAYRQGAREQLARFSGVLGSPLPFQRNGAIPEIFKITDMVSGIESQTCMVTIDFQ